MNSAALLNKQILNDIGARAWGTTARSNLSYDSKLALVRQHGAFTLAYSAAFQEGLEYFGNDCGFIAYKMVGDASRSCRSVTKLSTATSSFALRARKIHNLLLSGVPLDRGSLPAWASRSTRWAPRPGSI
jgi:hypothetical protein